MIHMWLLSYSVREQPRGQLGTLLHGTEVGYPRGQPRQVWALFPSKECDSRSLWPFGSQRRLLKGQGSDRVPHECHFFAEITYAAQPYHTHGATSDIEWGSHPKWRPCLPLSLTSIKIVIITSFVARQRIRREVPFLTAATPGTILRTAAKVKATAKSAVES